MDGWIMEQHVNEIVIGGVPPFHKLKFSNVLP